MKTLVNMGIGVGLLAALLAGEVWGETPWLDGYTARRRLSVTNLAAIASDQANVPILVKLTSANFSFQGANSDGHDVRFTSSDGVTPLSFERERHDAAAQAAEYWVKLPSLSSTSETVFYLYSRTTPTPDGADPANVWDSNYAFVYHMNQTSGNFLDSTSNARTAEPARGTPAAGFVDGAVSGNELNVLSGPSVPRPGTATFEAWFKPTNLSLGRNLVFAFVGANYGYFLLVRGSGTLTSRVHDGTAVYDLDTPTALAVGTWHYVADVYGDTSPARKLYLDGVLDNSLDSAAIPYWPWFESNQLVPLEFTCVMDEVRMSTVARSAAWIRAQNASMRDQLLRYELQSGGTLIMIM